jgi:GYF domain 2
MIFHVCHIDGTSLGEFDEEEFNRKVLAGELKEDFYWHEGMADWKPVAQYRILAKTQRISFTPPPRTTVKIDMNVAPTSPEKSKPKSGWRKIFKRD